MTGQDAGQRAMEKILEGAATTGEWITVDPDAVQVAIDAAVAEAVAEGIKEYVADHERCVEEAVKERDEEVARLRAAQFLPMGDNHHNALLCPYCDGAKAVAEAVASRDEEIERLTALLIKQETHSTEGARREEIARCPNHAD